MSELLHCLWYSHWFCVQSLLPYRPREVSTGWKESYHFYPSEKGEARTPPIRASFRISTLPLSGSLPSVYEHAAISLIKKKTGKPSLLVPLSLSPVPILCSSLQQNSQPGHSASRSSPLLWNSLHRSLCPWRQLQPHVHPHICSLGFCPAQQHLPRTDGHSPLEPFLCWSLGLHPLLVVLYFLLQGLIDRLMLLISKYWRAPRTSLGP